MSKKDDGLIMEEVTGEIEKVIPQLSKEKKRNYLLTIFLGLIMIFVSVFIYIYANKALEPEYNLTVGSSKKTDSSKLEIYGDNVKTGNPFYIRIGSDYNFEKDSYNLVIEKINENGTYMFIEQDDLSLFLIPEYNMYMDHKTISESGSYRVKLLKDKEKIAEAKFEVGLSL